MGVYLAVSYDTEHSVAPELPSSVISPDDYVALDKEGKKKVWIDYLRNDVWQDPALVERSRQQLETIAELSALFQPYGGKFTSFVLGRWLDYAVEAFGQQTVASHLRQSNVEIGSHSYEHQAYVATGDPIRDGIAPPLDKTGVFSEVRKANETIERHLGVRPIGLRTPMGNLRSFSQEEVPILKALQANGIEYVSSWLKKEKTIPNPIGTAPHFYTDLSFSDILEIPTVGLYDVHGTQPTRLLIFDEEREWSVEERVAHYLGLLDDALKLEEITQEPVFVPLVFHPWDVPHYDPELRFHKELLRFCDKEGIGVVSFGDINKMVRNR